jgi:hypothetical protein
MKTTKLFAAMFIFVMMSCGDKKGPKENVMEKQMQAMKASNELEAEIGAKARSTFQALAVKADNPNNPGYRTQSEIGENALLRQPAVQR